MDYESFLASARQHLKSSNRSQVQLMRLLCDVHDTPRIWKPHHATFEDVLRVERLCTLRKYQTFRKALELGLDPNRLGVEAACLLASYPAPLRKKALDQTTGWIGRHKVCPTYQLVAEYVKALAPERSPKAKRGELRRYIKTLQTLLRKHGIEYPPEPA